MPAVSALNLVLPSVTNLKPLISAYFNSFLEKSPSGPINKILFFDLWNDSNNDFFFKFSHVASKWLCPTFSSIKSLNLTGLWSCGRLNLKDCFDKKPKCSEEHESDVRDSRQKQRITTEQSSHCEKHEDWDCT